MPAQAVITETVIDDALRASQCPGMLTAHEIREELIRQLDNNTLKGVEVARHLNIAPARVTEMRKRNRQVQAEETIPLAQLLGMIESEAGDRTAVQSVAEIANWGKVAQGVWMEQTEREHDSYVAYDRMRGDPPPVDLFAVTPEGNSMNKRFLPGTQLICRLIPFGIGQLRPGDYVIVERAAHDLREMTCKRIEVDAEGVYWLHSESTDERFAEPWRVGKPDKDHHTDQEIRVIAKVIRAVQDLENLTP